MSDSQVEQIYLLMDIRDAAREVVEDSDSWQGFAPEQQIKVMREGIEKLRAALEGKQ